MPRTTAAEIARMELLMETIAKGLIILNDRKRDEKEDQAPLLISKTSASLLSINDDLVATGRK